MRTIAVAKGLHLAEISGGLFDPTVGPLMKARQMNSESGEVPEPADLARAKSPTPWAPGRTAPRGGSASRTPTPPGGRASGW